MTRSITSRFQALNYELLLPDRYNNEPDWPLIVFLHGSGRRGNDITRLNHYGLNGIAKEMLDFKFMLLTPQCPSDSAWTDHKEAVLALIREVVLNYRIDPARIYMTGFSLGGHGTWEIAAHSPETFAAIAPIAGWCDIERAERLRNMPIWNFHGEEDEVVPIERSEAIVNEVAQINPNVRFTRYPGANHGVMDMTYRKDELLQWLLQHKLCSRKSIEFLQE